jgi:hypothetical protein
VRLLRLIVEVVGAKSRRLRNDDREANLLRNVIDELSEPERRECLDLLTERTDRDGVAAVVEGEGGGVAVRSREADFVSSKVPFDRTVRESRRLLPTKLLGRLERREDELLLLEVKVDTVNGFDADRRNAADDTRLPAGKLAREFELDALPEDRDADFAETDAVLQRVELGDLGRIGEDVGEGQVDDTEDGVL